MIPFALALAVWAAPPEAVAGAVAAALAIPDAQVEVLAVKITAGKGCAARRAEARRPVTGSGEVPLRFSGADPDGRACQAFGWASVRVTAHALVATRTIRAGEPLESAVAPAEVEVRSGRSAPLAALPPGGRAARTLPAGSAIGAADVRQGPRPGDPVTVVIRGPGGLELSQDGRALPCRPGRACAMLPGGRRVEGRLADGHLLLEAP